jgi:hypothetical protein
LEEFNTAKSLFLLKKNKRFRIVQTVHRIIIIEVIYMAGKKRQPLKGVVFAPIGPNGEQVKILEYCEGVTTYFVPDEVRIAYAQDLLNRAAETLSKV